VSIPKWKRHLPKLLGTAVVVGVGLGVLSLISRFLNAEPVGLKKQVHTITLLKPPPPPPPPPKIEKPPEPEVKEKLDLPEPEQLEDLPDQADEAPAGDLLGLDAEGGAGGDAFGLIGRKGGRGLLSGDPFLVYASQLQKRIEDALLDTDTIRKKSYSVVARIWVAPDGSIRRAELSSSSGDDVIDGKLVDVINRLQALAEAPPEGMPQPIKLRITSRL
jgi:periplasmic protein TonB